MSGDVGVPEIGGAPGHLKHIQLEYEGFAVNTWDSKKAILRHPHVRLDLYSRGLDSASRL